MNFELFDKAKEKFGLENQFVVALEELSELQKEITKYMRCDGNREHLIEEIADVRIMLAQITYFLQIQDEEILKVISFKLKRLAKRIEGVKDE